MKSAVIKDRVRALLFVSLIYLSLPVFLFTFGWLKIGIATILSLSLGLVLFLSTSQFKTETSLSKTCIAIMRAEIFPALILFLWCLLSGCGGFGFQNSDYAASNALLKDLIEQPWPLQLRNDVPLVYYVLYYLPAAFIGKVAGWTLANVIIFVWTFFALFLIWCQLALVTRLNELPFSRRCIALLMMILFGGFDFFGAILTYGIERIPLGTHIEWWASIGQFSSSTTLLFWVPQHALAPWLVTVSFLTLSSFQIGYQFIFLFAALAFLWSPIASLGLLPFLAIFIFTQRKTDQWRKFISVSNFALAPAISLTGLFYYSSNAFQFPTHWQFGDDQFLKNYLFLFFLETVTMSLPFFFLLLKKKESHTQPPQLSNQALNSAEKFFGWTAIVVLAALPTFKLGIMNDLCMRASIPAMMMLMFFWLKCLQPTSAKNNTRLVLSLLCLVFGSGSAISEIYRSVTNYSFRIPPINRIASLRNASKNPVVEQRAGNPESLFWKWLARQSE